MGDSVRKRRGRRPHKDLWGTASPQHCFFPKEFPDPSTLPPSNRELKGDQYHMTIEHNFWQTESHSTLVWEKDSDPHMSDIMKLGASPFDL
jgi:hypothetical protein